MYSTSSFAETGVDNRLTITKPQSQGDAMQDSNGPKFPVGTVVHVRRGRDRF